MDTLKRLEEMKTKLEALNQERAKQIGKREQLMDSLRARGINSYEEGVERERMLTAELAAAEEAANQLVDSLLEKYKGFL